MQSRIRIEETKVADRIAEVWPLLAAHWEEIARNKDVMVLAPDAERYQALEDLGMVIALAAYDGGAIVGYCVTFVVKHLHYAGLTYATNDVLYVHPDYRRGRTGLRLIRETERLAKERGARLVLWHAKEGTPLVSIFSRLGYTVQDIIFAREF